MQSAAWKRAHGRGDRTQAANSARKEAVCSEGCLEGCVFRRMLARSEGSLGGLQKRGPAARNTPQTHLRAGREHNPIVLQAACPSSPVASAPPTLLLAGFPRHWSPGCSPHNPISGHDLAVPSAWNTDIHRACSRLHPRSVQTPPWRGRPRLPCHCALALLHASSEHPQLPDTGSSSCPSPGRDRKPHEGRGLALFLQ